MKRCVQPNVEKQSTIYWLSDEFKVALQNLEGARGYDEVESAIESCQSCLSKCIEFALTIIGIDI